MKKKYKLLLLCPFLIIVCFSLIYRFNIIIKSTYLIEEKIIKVTLNKHKSYGLPLAVIYYYIEKEYDNKQELHTIKTNMSLEQFISSVESNDLVEARHANFHNIYDCHNIKYLSRDGKYEYIVKVDKDEKGEYIYLELINDPINKGTYNFFNQAGTYWERKMHHVDVVLWVIYGTGRDDPSSLNKRLEFYFTKNAYCEEKEVANNE